MKHEIPPVPAARADGPRADAVREDHTHEVTPDLAYQGPATVNVASFGLLGAGNRRWVLIGAGGPGAAGLVQRAAAARIGPDARPAAIILTHGHFDHAGALDELAERWDAPIYAHELEEPYLTGRAASTSPG